MIGAGQFGWCLRKVRRTSLWRMGHQRNPHRSCQASCQMICQRALVVLLEYMVCIDHRKADMFHTGTVVYHMDLVSHNMGLVLQSKGLALHNKEQVHRSKFLYDMGFLPCRLALRTASHGIMVSLFPRDIEVCWLECSVVSLDDLAHHNKRGHHKPHSNALCVHTLFHQVHKPSCYNHVCSGFPQT